MLGRQKWFVEFVSSVEAHAVRFMSDFKADNKSRFHEYVADMYCLNWIDSYLKSAQ